MAKDFREADLYPAVKTWLESEGYEVRAEVKGCDVVGRREEELVMVELKRAVNLDLILQVVRRQEVKGRVYAAVPLPRARDSRCRELERLLKRLGVGLLYVMLRFKRPVVELAFHPMEQAPRKRAAATRGIMKEMDGRSLDLNVGGSVGKPLMTAYRESALGVAVGLELLGEGAPRELKSMGIQCRISDILRDNHYGWFERVRIGRYKLTRSGRKALDEYVQLADLWRDKLADVAIPS